VVGVERRLVDAALDIAGGNTGVAMEVRRFTADRLLPPPGNRKTTRPGRSARRGRGGVRSLLVDSSHRIGQMQQTSIRRWTQATSGPPAGCTPSGEVWFARVRAQGRRLARDSGSPRSSAVSESAPNTPRSSGMAGRHGHRWRRAGSSTITCAFVHRSPAVQSGPCAGGALPAASVL